MMNDDGQPRNLPDFPLKAHGYLLNVRDVLLGRTALVPPFSCLFECYIDGTS